MADKNQSTENTLTDEVAKKYMVQPGIGIGRMNYKGEVFNLHELTLHEADELVKEGLTVLIPLPAKPPEAKATVTKP